MTHRKPYRQSNGKSQQQPRVHFPRVKQNRLSATQMMQHVLIALLPGIMLQWYLLGFCVIIQLLLALCTATVCEWSMAKCRARPLNALEWQTGLLSAVLLALALPAIAPWYVVVVGVCFAIVIGKHVFGGVGMNIFNPAMLGFCVVALSFPQAIALWPLSGTLTGTLTGTNPLDFNAMISTASAYPLSISDSLRHIFTTSNAPDTIAGATVLGAYKADSLMLTHATNTGIHIPATHAIAMAAAWLIGGIYLWYRQIADWRLSITLMVVFVGLLWLLWLLSTGTSIDTSVVNSIGNSIGSPTDNSTQTRLSLSTHFFHGSLIFTACFIITDPTTAATSRQGRFIYAIIVATVAVLIRNYSNLPDGFAFAILFGNLCVPLIDEYTKPIYAKQSTNNP
ncbi:RnfABCDGE type electron transport complex subunit D [Ostreibacterium oceani]|uniref:Ion-translocating oxidoreductase complex subunit D n=1 Tax=Ostreibacterium oceani TaxID=2654998 RepID=A0A6N7EV36_9GAMM|nr:RnfABCDGE type electron transport complex subunit D [Ostreibacterium oceani]MPV85833.1 hypothetical protein [Ostreibacterium oceani]